MEGLLQKAVDEHVDLIISSAGVSVGAFDFIKEVIEAQALPPALARELGPVFVWTQQNLETGGKKVLETIDEFAQMKIRWEGQGVAEKGYLADRKCIVAVDPRYFRPTEVEALLGDATKAKQKLGWTPKISFKELVSEMMREDLKAAERDELVKKHGYSAYDYHE